MKKYTTFILSIGIISSQVSILFADTGDLPNPKEAVPFIVGIVKNASIAAITYLVQRGMVSTYDNSKKNGGSWWEYYFKPAPTLKVITHEQLSLKPELAINTFASLPQTIQTILTSEKNSNTGEHKPIILYGIPGTGKTTLAQQIALETGGNYYHVHQEMLDGHSDATVAKYLRIYVNMISNETTDGTISTLHLEEFGKQLGKSMQNDMHNAEHGPFENTWKRLLQDLETQFPKVRVVACSNFGQDGQSELFNNAVTGERAHVIKIDTPNNIARQTYSSTTCAAHLEKEGVKNSKVITGSIENQTQRNQKLTDEYLVSTAMHERARKKHEDAINNSTIPWSINTLLWPPSWVQTWKKNRAAAQMKANGYATPVVDWDLTTTSLQQKKQLVALTEGLRYRQLNAITENARRDKLQQVVRVKQKSENPACLYTVNKEAKTYSLSYQDDEGNNVIATAPFGKVQPRNLVQSAACNRIEALYKEKKQHPELSQPINAMISTMSGYDLRSLAEKLKEKRRLDAIKNLIEYKKHEADTQLADKLQ